MHEGPAQRGRPRSGQRAAVRGGAGSERARSRASTARRRARSAQADRARAARKSASAISASSKTPRCGLPSAGARTTRRGSPSRGRAARCALPTRSECPRPAAGRCGRRAARGRARRAREPGGEARSPSSRRALDEGDGQARRVQQQLDGLDAEGRLVVGQVAMRNFGLVRDRLRNIVLRADVGVTEEAWEVREEQLTRVRNLQLERSRSEQQLNEELREVLDDMGETDECGQSAGEPKVTKRSESAWKSERCGSSAGVAALGICGALLVGLVPPTRSRRRPKGTARGAAPAKAPTKKAGKAPRRSAMRPTPERRPRRRCAARRAPSASRTSDRRRPMRRSVRPSAAAQGGAAAAAAHARSSRRASSSLQTKPTEYEKARQGLPRRHHHDRPAPLRGQATAACSPSLDREIDVEKKALREAREEAIKRLEEFVARYCGANAHPENTPDAMFRLAALYEERARSDSTATISPSASSQPIALYKRIINEFPNYRELAGIYYYLGHALNDSEPHRRGAAGVALARLPQQIPVSRRRPIRRTRTRTPSSACRKITTRTSGAAGRTRTRRRSVSTASRKAAKPGEGQAGAARPRRGSDETVYVNPYPDELHGRFRRRPTRAPSRGTSPRSGGRSATGTSTRSIRTAGPLQPEPRRERYPQSMKYKKPPLYGVAMYKLAWTLFKQQRYETAVHEFVKLLNYTDEQEKIDRRSGRRLPRRGLHVHRRLAHVPRLQRARRRRAVHPAQRRARHRDRTRRRRAEDARRDRPRAGSEADPARQEVDGRDLQGARAGVPRGQPVRTTRSRSSELILQEVADGPRRAERAEPDRGDLRPADSPVARGHARARRRTPRRRSRRAPSSPPTSATRPGSMRTRTIPRRSRPPSASSAAASARRGRPHQPGARLRRQGDRDERRRQQNDLARARARPSTSSPTSAGRASCGRTRTRRTRTRAASGSPTRATVSCVVTVNLDRVAHAAKRSTTRAKRRVDVRDSNEDDKFLQPAAFYVVDVAEQVAARPVSRRTSARAARRASRSAKR